MIIDEAGKTQIYVSKFLYSPQKIPTHFSLFYTTPNGTSKDIFKH
jgi:hypothetical protein